MPFDLQAHRQLMVDRFMWLETQDLDYAMATLEAYRRDPHCPCPDILADVKAEKKRRSTSSPPSESK